jgi:hypothetical protein
MPPLQTHRTAACTTLFKLCSWLFSSIGNVLFFMNPHCQPLPAIAERSFEYAPATDAQHPGMPRSVASNNGYQSENSELGHISKVFSVFFPDRYTWLQPPKSEASSHVRKRTDANEGEMPPIGMCNEIEKNRRRSGILIRNALSYRR